MGCMIILMPRTGPVFKGSLWVTSLHVCNTRCDSNLPILRYLTTDYWIDIGRLDDYSEAQEVYQKHIQNQI